MKKSPVDSYYYLYVIVKAEENKLLNVDDLKKLAYSLDLPTFRQRFVKHYPNIKILPDLQSIHGFLTKNPLETNWRIIKNSPESIFEFLIAYFMVEYEVENIKTIIKSKSLGMDYKEISRDINLNVEKILGHEKIFNNFIYLDDIKAGFEVFKDTIYYEALKKAEEFYENKDSLAFFDIFLDKALITYIYNRFNKLKRRDRQLIGEQVNLFIDYYNLKTFVRGKTLGFKKELIHDLLIFNNQYLEKLIDIENIENIINFLTKNSIFSKQLKKLSISNAIDLLTFLRDSYHQKTLNILKSWTNFDFFGLNSPFSLLMRKRFQVEDLKLISIGTDYDLDPKEILEKTILCRNNN